MPRYDSIEQLPTQHQAQAAAQMNIQPLSLVPDKDIAADESIGRFRYEHDLQAAVFQWRDENIHAIPELEMLHITANGQYRPGQRPEPGLIHSAGYPDISLDVARGQWHGLRIELKVGRNKPTERQRDWLRRLHKYGYKTAVCRDLPSAQALIVSYLKGDSGLENPRPL